MYDLPLILEISTQIQSSIEKVLRRFESIKFPTDFLDTMKGQDQLDAICMQLIVIGESVKNLDKVSGDFLNEYPEIEWKKVKGLRDVVAHQYFDIDVDVIYNVCNIHLPNLSTVVNRMLCDLKQCDESR